MTRPDSKIKKEFRILGTDGKLYDPKSYKYGKAEENFKIMVEKEALGKEFPGGEPEFIKPARRFGIDWESMSDIGHMRYGPLAALIFDLVADYSKQVVDSLGIPVYSVKGTPMFRLSQKPIKEHAKLFGERLYDLEPDKKKMILRYAACFQQFAMMKDWIISYKNLPFMAFEIADSYRLEQSGETVLLYRARRFTMPDAHVLCKDLEQSMEWSLNLHKKVYEEIKKLGEDYYSLYNLTSKEFFEKNKDFFMELLKVEQKPVLLCFYPPGTEYYWVLNIEYNIIDKLKRVREIATVQIDVGNAERFGIKYTDSDNARKYPIILHTAMIGSIERYLYTLFDVAVKQKNPSLPFWVSPVQARLCPVNDSFVPYCQELAKNLSGIRVDIDDRPETIQRKIRDAEHDWVPLIIVVGEKEKVSGSLAVRFRETGKVQNMKPEAVLKLVKERTAGYPYRELPLPILISKRPIFFG